MQAVAVEGRRIAFVFPGQGSQWVGMAVELLDAYPAFRDRLHACGQALEPHVDWSLEDVLRGTPGAPAIDSADDVIQPVLWAVMVSLAELWRSLGVHPSAVVGHSQGEIAAAAVAGALSLDDAARVVALRSRLLARLAGLGGMVSLPEPLADVIQRLEPVSVEIERQREPVLVIAHQAVVRALYGYLTGKPQDECPHVEIPLHTVVQLTPTEYGYDEQRLPLLSGTG